MKLFSATLFFFAFSQLATGLGESPTSPHAPEGWQAQLLRRTAPESHDVVLEQYILALCTERMMYRRFANIKWVGPWPGPTSNDPTKPDFALKVAHCMPLVREVVKKWDQKWSAKSQGIWYLCATRCGSKDFGGLKYNGPWPLGPEQNPPPSPKRIRQCLAQCEALYNGLFTKVTGGQVHLNRIITDSVTAQELKSAVEVVKAVKKEVQEERIKNKGKPGAAIEGPPEGTRRRYNTGDDSEDVPEPEPEPPKKPRVSLHKIAVLNSAGIKPNRADLAKFT